LNQNEKGCQNNPYNARTVAHGKTRNTTGDGDDYL